MRRNYISPEFEYKRQYGTLNMSEKSTFFGSKMLEIDDKIEILNENVIYYQLQNGEQLNFDSESNLPQIILDTSEEKKINHTLVLDQQQSQFDRLNNTKWIMEIDLNKIIRDYLFATLKKWRTFEGVKNDMTINNNVNNAIIEYISKNILNRYEFEKIDFFLKPIDLLSIGGLQYKNTFNDKIENQENKFIKIESELNENLKLKFIQPKPSSRFSFDYYFNIYFNKI